MTLIHRSSPWDDLFTLRRTMERLFDDDARPRFWRATLAGAEPALDITTNRDDLIVRASLAGWKPEDVEITLTGNTLTIAGQLKQEGRREEDSWILNEIRRGSFSRTLELPDGLVGERATAAFENGVLTLRIPKVEAIKPKQIRISTSATDTSTLPADAPTSAADTSTADTSTADTSTADAPTRAADTSTRAADTQPERELAGSGSGR